MEAIVYYQSPVGLLQIGEVDGSISSLRFVSERTMQEAVTPLLSMAVKQLSEYFTGQRKNFDLPLKQDGTQFQQKVWAYLSTIPYGETVSYKSMASAIGLPKGSRAVGSANGKNHIAIIVPCHRVINESGNLGGYAYSLEAKKFLLDMECLYKG